jgi:hypothetical protein
MGAVATGASHRRVVLGDDRGGGRRVRVTWHPAHQQFVISHWRDELCIATVRIDTAQAQALADLLTHALRSGSPPVRPAPGAPANAPEAGDPLDAASEGPGAPTGPPVA